MRSAAFVSVLLFLAPATASAICGGEPPIKVWPHHGSVAPTNAQIVVEGTAGTLRLVTAPGAQPRKEVPLTQTGNVWKPTALDPSTNYELLSGDRILGVFTTGTLADSAPPSWPGITKAFPPAKPSKGVQVECAVSTLRLEGAAAASDDLTSRGDIRYALWLGKSIDYTAPPQTWTTIPNDWRSEKTFTLVYPMDDLPKERPLLIGVKAIDLAGNATPASELTLK